MFVDYIIYLLGGSLNPSDPHGVEPPVEGVAAGL